MTLREMLKAVDKEDPGYYSGIDMDLDIEGYVPSRWAITIDCGEEYVSAINGKVITFNARNGYQCSILVVKKTEDIDLGIES